MQTFKQKKIALAVGTALMVMAGAAQAAAPILLASATKSTLVHTPGAAAGLVAGLYTTAGVAGGAGVSVDIGVLIDTANVGLADAGLLWNTGTTTPAVNDDFLVTFTPAGGAVTLIPAAELTVATTNVVTTATGVVGAASAGTASGVAMVTIPAAAGQHYRVNLTLKPGAANKIRINNTNGQLEYSLAGGAFGPVSMQVLKAGANPLDIAAAGVPIAASLTAAVPVTGSSLAQAATTKTYAAAAASKISGLTVDFKHPVTAPTTTELDILSRIPTPLAGSTSLVKTAGSITAATGTAVTIAAVTGSTTAYDVKVGDMTKPDWDNTDAAGGALDIAAAASSIDFNTGVNGASVPMELGFKAAKAVAYTNIYKEGSGAVATTGITGTGTVAFAATGVTSTDGAAPVLVSAVTDTAGQPAGTSRLSLTFSEQVVSINAGNLTIATGDLREVAENVKLGADTLAALNLNAGGTLAAAASAPVATNLGVVDITGIQTTDLTGKQVTVAQGISVKESNDASYVAATPALDNGGTALSGGVTTAANEFLSSAATTTTATPLAITFNSDDTTATAATTVLDPTKVGSITVKFAAGKEVALNATAPAKTLADLAADLVVTVKGLAGQTPLTWQFHPAAADLTLSALGDTLTIALPTALIYSKIDLMATMKVGYLNTAQLNIPVADVLVGKANAAVKVASTMANPTDGEPVILPLSATATANTLLTQSITGTLTGASNGSRVLAYLAKWDDAPAVASTTTKIDGGKITRLADGLATNLAIEFDAGNTIASDIDTALAAATKAAAKVNGVSNAVAAAAAAPFRVYATLIRSNDLAVANTKGSQNYLEASVRLSSKVSAAQSARVNAADPIYELMLNPVTGALTGTLNGQVAITTAKTLGTRGLVSSTKVAEGLVNAAGKFNLLAGVEPTTADLAKGAAGGANLFLILVHEDQANARQFTQLTSGNPADANYVPFAPNLMTLSGARTVLGAGNGIAAPTVGAAAAVNINLANYKVDTLQTTNTNWTLYSAGNPARAAVAPVGETFPRSFIGLTNGVPKSLWTADAAGSNDMAMTLVGNKVSLATELTDGSTLSTFNNASFVTGAAAIALNKGATPAAKSDITFAQAAAPAGGVKVPKGWSLVQVPATGTLTAATADAVIRVGEQAASQFTWLKADGAAPTLTAGEPVFVYSKAGGAL